MGSHWMAECTRYKTYPERVNRAREKQLCTKCLRPGHNSLNCAQPKICQHCRGRHPKALCKDFLDGTYKSSPSPRPVTPPMKRSRSSSPQRSPSPSQTKTNIAMSNKSFIKETLYMCTENYIWNPENPDIRTKAVVIWDSCSGISYMKSSLAERLELPTLREESIDVYPAFARKPLKEKYKISRLVLSADPDTFCYETELRQKDFITQKTPVVQFDVFDPKLWQHSLSFPVSSKEPEILLGIKDYNLLKVVPDTKLPNGFTLYKSLLGPFLSGEGRMRRTHNNGYALNSIVTKIEAEDPIVSRGRSDRELEQLVERQLSLDTAGLADCEINPEDEILMDDFMANLTRDEEGRYQARLLWNDKKPLLPVNLGLAKGRFRSILKNLRARPEILKVYDETIKDQLRKGIIEKVDSPWENRPGVHYLAHQAVVRSDKEHTKVRVVYDGSAKVRSTNSPSLNECLWKGPLLLQDLTGVLLRFRLMTTAVCADIEKAFLQIKIDPRDRDSTRFFWSEDPFDHSLDETPTVYRFTRVLFGLSCSPFLLAGTIRAHLLSYPESKVAKSVLENIYVDNILIDIPENSSSVEAIEEAIKIFGDGKMNLREITSNDLSLLKQLPKERILDHQEVKILGIKWDTHLDWLTIMLPEFPKEGIVTKRKALSIQAMPFDPLGLISPVLLPVKLFMNYAHLLTQNWDQELPAECQEEWQKLWKPGEDFASDSIGSFSVHLSFKI